MSFTPTVLYAGEKTGSGTTAIATATFAAKDCTGMTKQNGAMVIDLKCSNISLLTQSQLEISSSGTFDSEEWGRNITASSPAGIGTGYSTFTLPLTAFGTTGGELDVSAIDYIRWYVVASSSVTIGWKNARVYPYSMHDIALDLSLQKDAFANLAMMLQAITGEWLKDMSIPAQVLAQKMENLKLLLHAAKEKLSSLGLTLSVTDGTVLQDFLMLLDAIDGTVFKDIQMDLRVIKATPAFRSVTAHRIGSVISEVV